MTVNPPPLVRNGEVPRSTVDCAERVGQLYAFYSVGRGKRFIVYLAPSQHKQSKEESDQFFYDGCGADIRLIN